MYLVHTVNIACNRKLSACHSSTPKTFEGPLPLGVYELTVTSAPSHADF